MCHPLGISVEAELGAIGGEEGGGLVGEADKSLFTDPDQAAEFVEFTGMSQVALKVLKEGMNKTGNSYNDYPFANDES